MNTKGKGKAIMGIALAAIMVAALMAMVPTVSADDGYSPYPAGATVTSITLIKGTSNVNIIGWPATAMGPVTIVGATGTDIEGETHVITDVTNFKVSTAWGTGLYGVGAAGATNTIFIEEPSISAKIKLLDGTDVTGKSAVSMTQVNIIITTNFGYVLGNDPDPATIKLKVVYPDGVVRTEDDVGHSFTDSNVTTDEITFVNITFDDEGEYAITAMTPDPGIENNSKLVKAASTVTLTVITEEVTIDVEDDTVPESEDVVVIASGKAKVDYYLKTTKGEFKPGVSYVAVNTSDPKLAKITTASDGTCKAIINTTGLSTGSYTVYIYETIADRDAGNEEDKVDFSIVEIDVTVETDKITYVVGEDVMISGTASAGDYALIAIQDRQVKREKIKADGTFEYKWTDSNTKAPGVYKIEVWIEPVTIAIGDAPGDGESTRDLPAADASTAILLASGALTAELSTTSVSLGDDFEVSGVSRGADTVNIMALAPRGSGGTKITNANADNSPSNHIYEDTASVSTVDRTFSKKIDVDKDADTGKYLIVVLSPGIDGRYNGLSDYPTPSDFFVKLVGDYNLDVASKTQAQLLAMVQDASIDTAGSDDMIWLGYVKVESAYVTLDTIADVGVGEPLVVTGASNRKDGHLIIIEVSGPETLAPATVAVEDGAFNATIDTTGVAMGIYTVAADDGDGHTDTVDVEILEEVVPIATPTPEPTAEPTEAPVVPTPEPTAEPTPTPTEEPGFEAVFAIAGLLSIAYLVLRKRK